MSYVLVRFLPQRLENNRSASCFTRGTAMPPSFARFPCLGKTASKPSHSSLMTALQLDSTRGCEAEKRYTGHTYTYSIASASRQRELYAGLRLTIPESAIGAEHRSCGWFADGLSDGPRCAPLFSSQAPCPFRSARSSLSPSSAR